MRFLISLFSIIFMSSAALAQPTLEDFAALPSAWQAEISPDGKFLAVGCSPRGIREICVYDLEGQTAPRLIVAPEGVDVYDLYWPSPTHLIFFISSFQRVGTGSGLREIQYTRALSWSVETSNTVMLLSQFGGGVGNLTNITSSLLGEDDRVVIELTGSMGDRPLTGSNLSRRQDYITEAYEVDLDTGNSRGFHERSSNSVIEFVLDAHGELLAEVQFDNDDGRYKIRRRINGREDIYDATHLVDRPTIYGGMDNNTALAVHFPDGDGLMRLDLMSGERTSFGPHFINAAPVIDRYAGELVGFRGVGHLPQRIFHDEELASLQTALEGALPEDSVIIESWTPDRSRMIVVGRDMGLPATYYLFDRAAGNLEVIATQADALSTTPMAHTEAFSYTARDGLEIPSYLTLPSGMSREEGPFPLILMPHGGPRGRDTGVYDWQSAYLASLGYAVLRPNFRGSTQLGIAHLEAGYGEFGRGMITDMIDGVHHLQSEGVAKDDGYCVMGSSYGGYAALMVALEDPAQVKCSISVSGVVDPMSMIADGFRSDTFVAYWERYMGSRFASDTERAHQSPLARVGEFNLPVLLVHGDEDVVVPIDQSQQFFREANDHPEIDMVTLPGENHYLDKPESRNILLQETTSFLQEHFPVGE